MSDINMSAQKNPMPSQDPNVRNANFNEVAHGYTPEIAIDEARRCLNCTKPLCISGCPVHVQIPNFIAKIAKGDFEGAYETINETNALPAICGRVCPQESQCEAKCVRGIKHEPVAIGRLERFAADYHLKNNNNTVTKPHPNGHKVAIVGSGPSGLSCAGSLASKGYDVTIYEALHLPGGVLVYGIPEFRLPKSIVAGEIKNLENLGVKIETNTVIGKTISVDELMNDMGYEAIYLCTGAGLPKFMNIPGENLNGVFSANEFLTRVNLMKAFKGGSHTPIYVGKRVAIVGGGNVAMDAARCAKRLGATESIVVYRRTEKELPARAEEVEHAMEEGVKFMFLTNPIQITDNGNGWVGGICCQKMSLSEPDASGRAKPIPIPNSDFLIDVDCVIMSIGTSPNPLIGSTTPGLDVKSWGGIVADPSTGKTSRNMIYAGGDAVSGAATVILAMGAGKQAAEAIDSAIMNSI